MFEEFDPRALRGSRRQLAASVVASAAVYLGLLGSVVAASAAYRKVIQPDEELVQIELKTPPKPEPPPPPEPPPIVQKPVASPKPVSAARPKAIRPELKAPDEIPDETPEEADGPLPDAPPEGLGQEGFLDGVVGGTGTARASEVGVAAPAPPPPPPKPTPPAPAADNAAPEYPRAARRAGIGGIVKVRVWISAEGLVTRVDILEGDEIFHEAVREALMTWRYTPARMPDGTAVSVRRTVHIPFQIQ
jgi:protein TonB